jgi:hypothetical protein
MSLSSTDLLEIRSILKEELKQELEPIKGGLEALSNDVKEIYSMIADLQRSTITDPKFEKLTIEKKLLALNAELLEAARQVGITLPR